MKSPRVNYQYGLLCHHLFVCILLGVLAYWSRQTNSTILALVLLADYVFIATQLHKLRDAKHYEAHARILEFVLHSAKEGIYGLDLQGKTTFANVASLQITGHSASEMIGIPQHGLIHHTKPDGTLYKREQCHIYAALTKGTVQTVDNEVFWHKDGHPIPVEYTSTPMMDDRGKISGAVVVFKDITEQKKAKEDQRRAVLALADHFERDVKTIVDAVFVAATDMNTTAQTLATTAEETRQQVTAVATASDEAFAEARSVVLATEHLKSSISEIEEQALLATQIADRAGVEGQETNTTMQNLADVAQKIGQVTQLINAIASQTSLLALNATIEAARAGDAGKGFAVVASEVKALANQTAKATDNIETQISTIQSETMRSVKSIRNICKTISETKDVSTLIAVAINKQSATTLEMGRNVQKVVARTEKWLHNFGRCGRWNFCLTTGTLVPANQERQ